MSSALASDRKSLLADVDSMKKRENLLLEEGLFSPKDLVDF